jgi:hypothetical protein
MTDTSKVFLDDMDHIDFRVFIYCFVLKRKNCEVAKILKVKPEKIKNTCGYIENLHHFSSVCEEVNSIFEDIMEGK